MTNQISVIEAVNQLAAGYPTATGIAVLVNIADAPLTQWQVIGSETERRRLSDALIDFAIYIRNRRL